MLFGQAACIRDFFQNARHRLMPSNAPKLGLAILLAI